MRSIGKKNINLVKALTTKYLKQGALNVRELVRQDLPESLWDTWEMADQEINRIIKDMTREG